MNKYLEKIAAMHKVKLDSGDSAKLSDKEYKKYYTEINKNPGTGKMMLLGGLGAVGTGVGAHLVADTMGGSARTQLAAGLAGGLVGWHKGVHEGHKWGKRTAVHKTIGYKD